MESAPYRIERLTDERLPDVQRLMAEVLKQNVSLDWVRIKYDTRYTGQQYLSSIAYQGDRPVSFYGAVPQFFTTPKGERFLGCHIADSMTVTDHQRKGLYKQLALTAYEWMRAADVKVVYGFNSEATRIPCKKIGWSEGESMRGYVVSAAKIPLNKIFRRLPVLKAWHTRRIQKMMGKYAISPADFKNSNQSQGIAVEYSPEFFASKGFHPNVWVELEGVKFWLGVDAIVRVGDVHFEHPQQLMVALAALRGLCRRLGITTILFQTYAGSRLDAALATQYASFESWVIGYMELGSGIDFREYRPSYGDQDSF